MRLLPVIIATLGMVLCASTEAAENKDQSPIKQIVVVGQGRGQHLIALLQDGSLWEQVVTINELDLNADHSRDEARNQEHRILPSGAHFYLIHSPRMAAESGVGRA